MVVTVQQLYDYAFKNCLLHENVNCVLKYYKNSVPESNINNNKKDSNISSILSSSSGTAKNSNSKFDTLIEFTYGDVLELLSLSPKY